MSWAAWAGLVYLFHSCNILGCNILDCLGYLFFFFLEQILHLTKISSRPVCSLVLIWDIMESMSWLIWSFRYISSFTSLLALVAWFTYLSGLAFFTSFKRMVHNSVSKPSLGKSCWMVRFWNIFFIFWLNSSPGIGWTSLSSPGSSWSRVSPELMDCYHQVHCNLLLGQLFFSAVFWNCLWLVVVGLHQ